MLHQRYNLFGDRSGRVSRQAGATTSCSAATVKPWPIRPCPLGSTGPQESNIRILWSSMMSSKAENPPCDGVGTGELPQSPPTLAELIASRPGSDYRTKGLSTAISNHHIWRSRMPVPSSWLTSGLVRCWWTAVGGTARFMAPEVKSEPGALRLDVSGWAKLSGTGQGEPHRPRAEILFFSAASAA